jgi:hypothetical protein
VAQAKGISLNQFGDLKQLFSGWVMWDGSQWLPCDGTNGAPDLIHRPTCDEIIKNTLRSLTTV